MASPITRVNLSTVPCPEEVFPSGAIRTFYDNDSAVFVGAWMSVEDANAFVTKVNNTDKPREYPSVRMYILNEHMNQEGIEKLALVYFNCILSLSCSMMELHAGSTQHLRVDGMAGWFHLYRKYVEEWLSYEGEPRQWLKEMNVNANWSVWAYDEHLTTDDNGHRHTRTIDFIELDH